MAESNASELIWTDDFYTATEAVERSGLPFIVKVAEGFYGETDYESFSSDDVLKVYARNSLQKVEARVPGSSEPVSIPLAYNGAVKVLPLRDEFFVYRTIGEAMKDEKPTLLRVGKSITLTSRHNVLAGTILKIERIEKRMTPQGVQDFILCVGDHKDICLPLDCEGDFTVIPDTQCYQLKDVVDQKPLPCKITIVGGRERLALAKDVQEGISNMEDFSGQFTLMKTFMQEVLVCSTRIHEAGCPKESLVSKKNIIIIPLSPVPLDVSFFIAEDSPDYQKIIVKSFGTEIDISQVQDDDAYIEYMTNPRSRVFCGSTGSAPKVPPHTFRGDSNTSDRNGSAEVSGNVLDSDSEGDGYEEIDEGDMDELKQGRARREALNALFKGEEDQHGYLIPQQGEQIESKKSKTSPDRGKQTKKPVIRPNIKKAIGTVREIGKNIVSTFHKHQQHQNTEIAKTEQDVPPERPPKRPPKPASLKKGNPRKGQEPFRPPLDEDELTDEQLGQLYEEPEEPTPTVTPRTPKSPSDISSDIHPSSLETKEFWFPTGLKKQKESPTVNPVEGAGGNDCNPKRDEEKTITDSSKSNDGAMAEPNPKLKTSNLSRSKTEKSKPPVLPKPRTQRKFSDSSLLRDKGEEALTVTSYELKMVPTASVMPSRHIGVEPTVGLPVARPRHYQNQKEENTLLETTAEHPEKQEYHRSASRVQSPDPSSTNGTLCAESQSTCHRAQLRQRKPAQTPQPETLSEIRKSVTHVSSTKSDSGALSINSFDDVPSDLSMLSVTDLESVLQLYGLHNAAKICRVNEVDGALFMLLTDTILKEDPFNLKPFDILKIQNIKKGWKPKQSRQTIKS